MTQHTFHYSTLSSHEDIQQVLALQQANLPGQISKETAASQGFVTVQHNSDLLEKMNTAIPQVAAFKGGQVVGYALAMLPSFQEMIPVLKPMFAMFNRIEYRQRKIVDYNYYVMGQICIAEHCRGMGVFDRLYLKHQELFAARFDFCITEIAARNIRSMKAHERVGFKTIHTFEDETDVWNIVLWDWHNTVAS